MPIDEIRRKCHDISRTFNTRVAFDEIFQVVLPLDGLVMIDEITDDYTSFRPHFLDTFRVEVS